MPITSIKREFNLNPNLVGIIITGDDDPLVPGYFTSQAPYVEALNNGPWQWLPTDIIFISGSNGGGFGIFEYDQPSDTFIFAELIGGLPPGDIFVGDANSLAAPTTMTGAVTIDVNGVTSISSGAVGFNQLSPAVVARTTIQLSSSDIMNLYDTPIQLLPAPGRNMINVLSGVFFDIVYGTTQYMAGGDIVAQYGNAPHAGGAIVSDLISGVDFNNINQNFIYESGGVVQLPTASCLDMPLYLTNTTSAFTTGDSTVTLYLLYNILTVV